MAKKGSTSFADATDLLATPAGVNGGCNGHAHRLHLLQVALATEGVK